ncbi:hypothetical protein CHS0354_041834 [Potamilus streckersoni]|uniref:Uncharacterized protein n=1 Tax=Potamilus streckersoni TaxID=2493646 RepID=A0AAE0T1B5_9BIVA|nr:hypothetical protein CHS0354_041834 [Potamilus streckersoni]
MPSDDSGSAISPRPATGRSYQEYVPTQNGVFQKPEVPGGPKLWRQMVIGFICAACVGFVMLVLGSVFIGEAIKGDNSITIMLCVMGIVCGMIILVGTAILGRLFISRKWRVHQGRQPNHQPPQACFHTCSIIYTPSQDQLAGPLYSDPPPSYEMVVYSYRPQASSEDEGQGSIEVYDGSSRGIQPIIMLPPKYSLAAAPLPEYGDAV